MAKKFKLVGERGFTIVEVVIGFTVMAIVAASLLGLYAVMVRSELITKRKAVASTLANNQMEYVKSLPYNSLAVSGGSIVASNPIPSTTTKSLDGVTYTIKTSINYIDDAFDGCGSYPDLTLKQTYCRNYPPPSGAPATDTNPADYKIAHVSVYINTTKLAEVDTQISARVAETASNTGALFVKVIDSSGNPVSGANVLVTNTTTSPTVNVSDSTDGNGNAIFYGLPPDTTNYDYVITASQSGHSTLTTIVPSGTLQPNYPNQQILNQQSSLVTLIINPQGTNSLVIETTDTSGNVISGVKPYIKGGYKKYTAATDTSYYYDNMSPSDVRPVTDANGMGAVSNLVPGTYIFCGDLGATGCSKGATTYYLAAALPYGGTNPFNPIVVPTYSSSSPPTTTFGYGGVEYLQKVRLLLTTSSTYPRIFSISPYEADQSNGLSSIAFQVNGANLPCSSSPASCNTTIRFTQASDSYTASCTGTSGTTLNCTVNLSGTSVGNTQMVVTANGNTLTMPAAPLLGGIIVTP